MAVIPVRADIGDELFKLTASDTAIHDDFGYSVSIAGGTAVIGAPMNDDAGVSSGSVYLFDATAGNELAKLTASDAVAGDRFGHSVALSGNTAIIGAVRDDDDGTDSGSAYLVDATTGQELFKLTASDAEEYDYFGGSVAISGNTALVGAFRENDAGSLSGSAYLFDVTTSAELFKLTASNAAAGDQFGHTVAVGGNAALVGAYRNSAAGSLAGSAYLFDVATGIEMFRLNAADASSQDLFGWSVAVSGNIALVGAPFDDGEIDEDNVVANSGSAYLFDVTTGQQLLKLTPAEPVPLGWFGYAVAINGDTAIVGSSHSAGAVYMFDVTTGQQLFKSSFGGPAVAISANIALVRGADQNAGNGFSAVYGLSALRETEVLPGDYNADGIVNAADYTVWRDNLGSENPLPNDSIGGTIGQVHYNQWIANFGRTAGNGSIENAAVPEPSSLLLAAIVGCIGLAAAARKPSRQNPANHLRFHHTR